MGFDPVVFISSTSDDLKEHRQQVARAALANGFSPRMMEYFPANGQTPTLQACLDMVAEAEVVVVLVAHRYGWVPGDPANTEAKSITWLECEHAWQVTNKEVLAFLIDPKYKEWPLDLKEDYRLIREQNLPARKYNRLRKEVQRNKERLEQFKQKLGGKFYGQFTDAASVYAPVSEALAGWIKRHPTIASAPPGDPEIYLKALGIDEIYIPLTTLANHDALDHKSGLSEERRIVLERALSHRNVVIIGEPGSGKSTFLRRTAFELCRTLRGTKPADAMSFLAPDDRRFPILIRTADLARLLSADKSPKPPDAPAWIPYFLGRQSQEYHWGLNQAFFRRKLGEGNCLVMVDRLDEAPDRRLRERISRLFEKATWTFGRCDFW